MYCGDQKERLCIHNFQLSMMDHLSRVPLISIFFPLPLLYYILQLKSSISNLYYKLLTLFTEPFNVAAVLKLGETEVKKRKAHGIFTVSERLRFLSIVLYKKGEKNDRRKPHAFMESTLHRKSRSSFEGGSVELCSFSFFSIRKQFLIF